MGTVMKNSAIASKICSMRSKMLTKENYRNMAELDSVAQVASYLKTKTVYKDALKKADEDRIHRESLEILLKTTLLDDFERIYCFADNELKRFLSKVLMFYETEAIIKVAHSIYAHSYATEELGDFLKRHIDVDIDALKKVSSLEKFVQLLSGTQYYKALSTLAKKRGSLNVLDIETALNIYCYTSVMKYISGSMDNSEKETVNMFYGPLIDIMNIKSLYRCKCNFNLESEYIYSHIIPYYYKIKKNNIMDMANAKSTDEFKSLMASTVYADVFKEEAFEKNIMRYMYKLSKKLIRLYPYSYVSINSYFRLKETELNNIFSVIEGIRYSLSADEIMSYVTV